ncbi:efflux RND transporter periplasmic adaptor subunit [Pseudoduganella sp. FT25W]|uniref:Efflux RND transporter periplasmic adaptor subunit n=1 Tax=Duganella alba TaxID=2666081 RepID=A0A6L5QJX5_9BURK|nr:efflux RND transporter periplasmic adaptor subunit [Duganella alba]MRX10029.1 efflux RND transporter periplasmic adaptor subunit [Duganella alba]MRX17776.1 efflux RND transporter periplasmic adaptor subunit [Duganella alba]
MKLETLPPISQPTVRSARWRKPAAVLVVIALAGGGWTVLRGKQEAAPAVAAAPVKEKKDIFELSSGDIAAIDARSLAVSLPLSGSLAPLSSATIKSKVSGVVEATTLQEGMAVSAGQVLARIDQADLRARLQQQQAMLDEAQAKLALATKNETNSQALLKQKYISQNAYDSTQNSVDLARASVKSASAMVELARIALNDGVIKAPIDGVISKRHVQAGEKLALDMPVYSIVNLAELVLEAQVPASEIPRVKVGQDVRFRVDGYAQRDFHGKVARINPSTEAGSRAMLVYIAVKNDDSALRAGMFAKGSIVTDRSGVAPIVPLAAVRSDKDGKQIVYKVAAGKLVAQPVKLGLRNDDEGYAEVTEGLEQGANVIVSRLDSLKPGALVKLPAGASAAEAPPSAQAKAAEPAKG